MKKTDIAMIILIATVGVMISFFTTQAILGGTSPEPQKVKVVDKISSEVAKPNPRIFNSNAINPSVEVEINGSAAPADDRTEQKTKEE